MTGIWRVFAATLAVLHGLALSACTPLATFDALVPKDGGTTRIATARPFGPDARQKLDVYAPAERDAALPVIIFFYGGSWNSGTRTGYGFVARALAARGFVVVVPDYRLVPTVRFPTFLEDNSAAVRWTSDNIGRLGGDPERMILMGHSAGAYNAAMLALDPRWLGTDRRAVRGLIGLAGPYDFLPIDGPVTSAAFGGWPNPAETQPISHAGPGAPPALLLTGDDDRTVAPRNSAALAQRLTGAGGSAVWRSYPGIGHVGILTALARPWRRRAPVLDDIAAFAHSVSRP